MSVERHTLRTGAAAALLLTTILGAGLSSPATSQVVDDPRQIDYPPLAEFTIPEPEVFRLGNGLTVYLLEDRELPLIQASARIRTGSLWEPAAKTGLAGLMGTVQRTGGTRSMTGDEIDDFLESRAASVETSVGGTVGFASMDCLAEDFGEVLPLFVDVLRNPVFDDEKLAVAKVQANSSVARRNDAVGSITGREFGRLVYGADSPLGRQTEYATIAAIERDDLVAWHAAYYHPNNILLGVVGDFDSTEMRRQIEAAFGDWPRGPEAATPPIPYRTDQAAGVYFVEKSDVTQANVRLGHLGIDYENPDFFAVRVMNELLSGGFSGRLMQRIRSELGLAYSVGGGVRAGFTFPGLASFGLETKAETMAQAVDELYREIRRMIADPPDATEMAKAKDSILNSFVFNYASRRQILGQQLLYAYYGLPADFLETYRDRIEAVTTADVARVAESYLRPDEATLLVVGPSAAFDRPLSTFGEVTEIDISIPEPPDLAPAVERTTESVAAGRKIVAEMAAALGGTAAGSTRAVSTTSEVQVTMQGQSMTLVQKKVIVFPDRVRVELETPVGLQTTVLAGAEGWVAGGGQVVPMPAERAGEQLADLGRDLAYMVRYHDAPDLEAVAAGTGEVDGVPCRRVEVALRGATSTLCVDDSGRVLEQSYRDSNPFTGAPGAFAVRLSDYRSLDGRNVPHRRVTTIDGEPFATSTIDRYEVDPELPEGLFDKPTG